MCALAAVVVGDLVVERAVALGTSLMGDAPPDDRPPPSLVGRTHNHFEAEAGRLIARPDCIQHASEFAVGEFDDQAAMEID